MRVLFVPFARLSSCSSGYNVSFVKRLHILRQISNKASTARAPTRVRVVAPTDKTIQPKAVVPSNTRRSGAFRPELFRFLNQDAPIILVQSQSPVAYKVGMYVLGGFCIAYGVVNYFVVLYDPPIPLSSFVSGTYYSINIAMVVLGVFCLYKTTRIISNVTAMPYIVNKSTGQKGLMLHIQTYQTLPIPGMSRKVMRIPASDVFTDGELGIPGLYNSTPLPPTRDEKMAERLLMRQKNRRAHQENMSRLYTLPFREAGNAIVRIFVGLREAIYGDSWVHLRAKNRNGTWRIGKDFEWALDAGHAFDKVIKVEKL